MRVLYWNLYRKNLIDHLAEIVESRDIDIVATSENDFCSASLSQRLSAIGIGTFIEAWNFIKPIKIFTRLPQDRVENIQDDGRITARRIKPLVGPQFTLIALHGPSKRNRTNSDQASWMAHTLKPFIDEVEISEGHHRTVLIGDFNANPFEESLIAAMGVHGVPCRSIAMKGARVVDKYKSKFFYNPMWSLMGDASPGPPGTFYRSGSSHHEYFWHMFDQVMIRDGMLSYLHNGDVEILTHTGKRSLLNQNFLPDAKLASDHLPIYLKLTF